MAGMEEMRGSRAWPLVCECIETEAGLDAVHPEWEALAEISPGAHIYQSHEWISAWLKHNRDGSPRLFVAHRGDRMTAALPLALHRGTLGPGTLRIAADSSDYCDGLCDPAYPDDLLALWREVLGRRDWHLMDLRYVRPDSLLSSIVAKTPGEYALKRQAMEIAPYLDLSKDWRQTVSKGQRSDWERRRRRLQEQGSLTLDVADSVGEVDRMLGQLGAMHAARWRTRGETSVFTLRSYRAQVRAVCHSMLGRGKLLLVRLALDGDPVSIGLHFLMRRRLLPYVFGFSERYARFCPVHQMVLAVVEEARARDLADIYDFGRGAEEYKLRWTQQSVQLGRVLVARRSPLALSVYLWDTWAKPLLWRNYRLNTAIREFRRRRQARHR